MKIYAVLLLLVMGVVGCASLSDVKEFTLADAKLALQWATEDKDVLASTCYATIVEILESLPADPPARDPNGALSTIYLARSIRKTIESADTGVTREKFLLGCAPLLVDQRNTIIKYGAKLYGF